jgi:hypothetical protein
VLQIPDFDFKSRARRKRFKSQLQTAESLSPAIAPQEIITGPSAGGAVATAGVPRLHPTIVPASGGPRQGSRRTTRRPGRVRTSVADRKASTGYATRARGRCAGYGAGEGSSGPPVAAKGTPASGQPARQRPEAGRRRTRSHAGAPISQHLPGYVWILRTAATAAPDSRCGGEAAGAQPACRLPAMHALCLQRRRARP